MRGVYLSAILAMMIIGTSLAALAYNVDEPNAERVPAPLTDSYVVDYELDVFDDYDASFSILITASVEGWYLRGADYFHHSDHYGESFIIGNTQPGFGDYMMITRYVLCGKMMDGSSVVQSDCIYINGQFDRITPEIHLSGSGNVAMTSFRVRYTHFILYGFPVHNLNFAYYYSDLMVRI